MPARLDQHTAGGFEVVGLAGSGHLADAGGVHELRSGVEHRDEAAHHKVVELLLGIRQTAGCFERGDDGKVVADLRVVKHLFAGLDVALRDGGFGKRCQVAHAAVGQHLHGVFDRGQVVLGQVARIGARVGQRFVALVQALRQGERGFGREAKTAIRLALQGGQVKQAGAAFAAGLAFFGDGRGLVAHRVGNGLCFAYRPHTVFFDLFVVGVGFVRGVEPFAGISAGRGGKAGVDFPVVAADELPDQLFALDHHRQRGRLHPTHGGEEKPAIAGVERGEGAGAVDAHQPIGLGAAAGRVGQALHLRGASQAAKAVADGLRRHRLQPQALNRFVQGLFAAGVLLDQTEDEFALAPRVTGVDDGAHIFALGLLDHRRQARFGFVDRLQVEVRRDDRQVRKAPLAALDVKLFGRLDFHQMAHRAGDHKGVVLEMIVVLFKLARAGRQGANDVLCHRGLLGDDQCFTHAILPCLQSVVSRARAHMYVFNIAEFSNRLP